MKHPTKKEKNRLMALVEQMDFLFSTNNFDRGFCFKKNPDPENEYCSASVSYDTKYQRLTITIFPLFWDGEPEEQRKTLLHEFSHVITEPLTTLAKDLLSGKLRTIDQIETENETATSRITQLLDAQLRGRNSYIRKAYAKYK